MDENMHSKYIVFATTLLLVLSSAPLATGIYGTYLAPASVATSGPLISKVVLSVYTTESTMVSAVGSGAIQGPEWTFSTGAYTSLGSNPAIIEGTTVQYSWFGLAFNTLKFPGNNVNFRRAFQFMQDYSYIQSTILNGVEGTASPDVLPCAAYGSPVCNPSAITSHYGSSQDLQSAGKELCQIGNITGSQCPSGPFTSSGTWTCNAVLTPACPTIGGAFSPVMYYRTTHHRNPWGTSMIGWAGSIGLGITGHLVGGGGAVANCFNPNANEVISPGVYNSGTGYNSLPTINATAVGIDHCDMLTFGFIAGPAFNGNMQEYNSQFTGSTTNTQNAYDSPTASTPADTVAGYASPTAHTTTNNLDYTSNKVLYAPDASTAGTWAQNFAGAYALQLPSVMGYFENELYANNANGWSDFAQIPITGPNELGGLFYTLMNVHQCGSATCTLGAVNGGTLGGTYNYALQQVSDQSGLNPVYNTNWVWQADVQQMVYDTQLATPPTQFNVVNAFFDYMTTAHSLAPFSGVTGTGGSWYYFQQPCNALSPNCPSRAFGAPGPKQHGAGLTVAQRTITGGQAISFTFRKDIYFYDGIQVTPKDYVFSLDFFNVAASPNYPDNASPASGVLGGAAGLIAAHTVGQTVTLYLGSASFWNQASVVSFIMPFHIWKYFNPDHVSTFNFGTVDVSKPFAATTSFSTSGAYPVPANSWMNYLNNLMIGSGAFWLNSWNGATGTGEIDANPFYFNANWQAMAAVNTGASTSFSTTLPLVIPIYNPTGTPIACGPSAPGPIAPNTAGMCQLMGSGMPGVSWAAASPAKIKVYNSGGILQSVPKTFTKNVVTGLYTFTINTSSLAPGAYEVVLKTTYSFHGQLRTWYQLFGFTK